MLANVQPSLGPWDDPQCLSCRCCPCWRWQQRSRCRGCRACWALQCVAPCQRQTEKPWAPKWRRNSWPCWRTSPLQNLNMSQPEIEQYGKQPAHWGPCLLRINPNYICPNCPIEHFMFFKDFLVAVHVSLGWSARVWVIPGWFALTNLQESTSFLNAVPIIQKAPHAELAAQVRLLMVFLCLQVLVAATRKSCQA